MTNRPAPQDRRCTIFEWTYRIGWRLKKWLWRPRCHGEPAVERRGVDAVTENEAERRHEEQIEHMLRLVVIRFDFVSRGVVYFS